MLNFNNIYSAKKLSYFYSLLIMSCDSLSSQKTEIVIHNSLLPTVGP